MLQIQIINFTISITASAVSVLLAIYARRQRHAARTFWFSLLLAAFGWVNWWYAFEEIATANLDAYITLNKLEYMGMVFIPYLWLRFARRHGGKDHALSAAEQFGLLVIPVISLLLTFTNEYHGLIWSHPRLVMVNGHLIFRPDYGVWFWVLNIYYLLVFMIGGNTLVRYALNTWRLYRVQASLILVAAALPWIGHLTVVFDQLNPFPEYHVNAVLMGISVLLFSFGLLRLQMLEVVPLAYETILNSIPAGILVVDRRSRILALNNSLKNVIQGADQKLIGLTIEEAFPRCNKDLTTILSNLDKKHCFEINNRLYDVSISSAYSRDDKDRGFLFIFSDVTGEVEAEKARNEEREFTNMVNRLGGMLNVSLDVKLITSSILESLDQLIPNSRLNIMLIDEDGFSTRVYQHRGYSAEAAAIQDDLMFDYRISPLFSESVMAPSLYIPQSIHADGLEEPFDMVSPDDAFATISIMVDGKPIGFINIDCSTPNVLTPELTNRVQIFGQQAALAIKNAQLYEKTRRQAEELKGRVSSLMIAQQVYKDIGFSIDLDSLLQLILDAALRVVLADAGYVALIKEGTLHLAKIYGNYEPDRLTSILTNQAGIIRQTLIGQNTIVMQTPSELVSACQDIRAQIAMPLFTLDVDGNDRFYGLIVLESSKPERFTQDRLQLLDLIRDRASVALQNSELVKRVQERAEELEILYGKVSHLEKFKTNMIRVAAHDLKNPLSVIRSYLSMFIDSPELEVDLDKVYPSMLRSTERMMQIIQNFLSMDRIEKAAALETMEPFDLSRLVASVAEDFAPQAAQKSQMLDVQLPHTECIVRGDSAQLYEAVSNFVSNAVKYTPTHGHIRIALDENGEVARLEVTDNGYGIPEDVQAKIFQPFYRAQTQETADIEGSGLGLHVTKTIIEQQQGEVIFSSVYNEGSTFGFTMPLFKTEKIETESQAHSLSVSPTNLFPDF